MSKRARRKFARKPRDLYPTPFPAVPPLIPHLDSPDFAEPCCGNGDLIRHLEGFGLRCVEAGDIAQGRNALDWHPAEARQIITNPPWRWTLLKPLIAHFIASGLPVWLLLEADWMHNRRSAPLMARCSHVVSVGRLKWEPGSLYTGKNNNAWYRFHREHQGWPVFIPRMEAAA